MAMPALKTFRGSTLSQALAQVRQDLGKDAVIVKTRSYRAGAVMGVGGKPVVEIIASAGASTTAPRSTEAKSRTRMRTALAGIYDDVPQRRRAVEVPVPAAGAADAPAMASAPGVHRSRLTAFPVDPAPIDSAANESLRDEIGSIKRMVGQLLRCSSQGIRQETPSHDRPSGAAILDVGGMPEPLFAQYTRLLDAGVETSLSETLIATVLEQLAAAQLSEAKHVRAAILEQLASQIPCLPIAPRTDGPKPLVIALIGPTGVGKTTTIAKLAAEHALRARLRVALITADRYRIGAVDQLQAYAEIIGVPMQIAGTPDEMARAVDRVRQCDLVLIDTAGRSPKDNQRVDELRAVVDAASADHRLLVLSAAASEAAMRRVAGRFAALRPSGLVLTKLDEAAHMGSLVNLPRAAHLPISHITTGQDVPDFIEPARPDRLAGIVLDGEVAA
ncbi:MAG: flagellar biosynthesis protein FlhF [Phycisphaerales bacterium]|nr:flagellar biosynthesis protein FlhF [Phycisphaerales bacterium]